MAEMLSDLEEIKRMIRELMADVDELKARIARMEHVND